MKIIALDFDGTVVAHAYPLIGGDIGSIAYLQQLAATPGVKIILHTMRAGVPLEEAVAFMKEKGIELWAVNKNPQQHHWTASPKIYANRYLDDAGHGIALKRDGLISPRPFVDWEIVGPEIISWAESPEEKW